MHDTTTAQRDCVGSQGKKSQGNREFLRRFEQLKAKFLASYTNFLYILHVYPCLLPALLLLRLFCHPDTHEKNTNFEDFYGIFSTNFLFNTSRTGDADLRFYITTVQDG